MIGISEILLIIVVGIFLLKPKDYHIIIKNIIDYYKSGKKFLLNIKSQIIDNHINECAKDMSKFQDEIITIYNKKYIYGSDGKLHEILSLNEIVEKNDEIKKIDK